MQNKLFMTLVLLHEELIDLIFFPGFEARRLILSKRCTHRKTCFGEIHRVFVFVCHDTILSL